MFNNESTNVKKFFKIMCDILSVSNTTTKDKTCHIPYFCYCQQAPWKEQNQQCVAVGTFQLLHPVYCTQPQADY